ncbi:hypothetical protein C8J57DRAFT_1311353 [Mycena rebaudengoi]|nr:hypothetical protein C8J57DRAFT_1311353 [Mycena rebaudengoi]
MLPQSHINPELALLVKSFDISASKLDGTHIHPLDLISAALVCTTNLETLNFDFARGAPAFIEPCAPLVLRADLDAEPALLTLLHRHPRLTVLKLFRPAAPFAALLSSTGVPCLLDLKYLKATAAVFPALLAPSGSNAPPHLTAAEIDWKLLVCFRSGPNLDLIPLVAQYFPRLVVLKVHTSSGLLPRAHDAVGRFISFFLFAFYLILFGFHLTLFHSSIESSNLILLQFSISSSSLSLLIVFPSSFQYTYAHFRFSIAHREHDRGQCTLNGHIWKRRAATGEGGCIKRR